MTSWPGGEHSFSAYLFMSKINNSEAAVPSYRFYSCNKSWQHPNNSLIDMIKTLKQNCVCFDSIEMYEMFIQVALGIGYNLLEKSPY